MAELSMAVELRTAAPPAGDVAVTNRSASAVRLFNTGNSWGDDAWSFELLRDGEARAIRRRPQTYTRNVPSARAIAPGATERWPFDLGDGTWDLEDPGDVDGARLVALYDAPPTPEADELGVSTGPIRSELVTLS